MRIGSAGLKVSVPYVDNATSFVTPTPDDTIAVTATTSRVVMTPRDPINSLSIEMPSSPVHGQLFHVSAAGQSVSGIKWLGTVVGGPDSIPSAHTTSFQFNAASKQWLCVER